MSHLLEPGARLERSLRLVRRLSLPDRCAVGVAIQPAALTPPGAKCVQPDVARDARCPRLQAARSRECFGRERLDDALERDLNEIVVVGLPATEDSVERSIDDADESIVKL